MKLTPQKHFVDVGDYEKEVPTVFTLEELKILQNMLLERIEYIAKEKNWGIKRYDDLALKLEYYITNP
jgi:hypothetical protein